MMERALKERIIGAAVLVLFVVLVVPVFLDGPPNEDEVVSERVLLPGQEEQKTQTVILDRDRKEPVPSAPAGDTPEPESAVAGRERTPAAATPAVAPAEEEPEVSAPVASDPVIEEPAAEEPISEELSDDEPARQPAVRTPAQSTTGMWAVQLGSFSNKENAEKLAADLRKQGYAAFLSQLESDKGRLHRVRIGPQKDRESAEAMAARLLKVGHKGQVVPHP